MMGKNKKTKAERSTAATQHQNRQHVIGNKKAQERAKQSETLSMISDWASVNGNAVDLAKDMGIPAKILFRKLAEPGSCSQEEALKIQRSAENLGWQIDAHENDSAVS